MMWIGKRKGCYERSNRGNDRREVDNRNASNNNITIESIQCQRSNLIFFMGWIGPYYLRGEARAGLRYFSPPPSMLETGLCGLAFLQQRPSLQKYLQHRLKYKGSEYIRLSQWTRFLFNKWSDYRFGKPTCTITMMSIVSDPDELGERGQRWHSSWNATWILWR